MKKFIIASPFLLSLLPLSVHADNTIALPPLTVTATRSEQDSRLVSSTVITRYDIERKQLNSVEQALRGVAGINISNSGGLGKNTSVFLRGTESDQILVLIDGVRVGSATTGGAAWQHIPISEIESIEVIRGPKSSIYGADAIGGIIHIHTRNAVTSKSSITPVFAVGVGTYAHYKVQGGVSGKVDKAWYNTHLSYQQTEGFNSCAGALGFGCFTNEPDRDGYQNYAGSLRLGYQFTDWLSVEGHALYSGGNNEFDGSFVNEADFAQLIYGGKATIQAMDFWRIDLSGGVSEDDSTNYLNGMKQSVFDTQRVSFAALNNFTFMSDYVVSLGYDFQDDSIDSTESFSETSRNNHAVFIQYQGQLANNQFVLAYRSDFNQQFGQNSTWNASWGYAFDNGILVSASYGTAFKAPTFNELYFPGFGNSDLNPEKSESYEIGVSGEHTNWNWSLNGYLTYIDDMIAFDGSIFAPNNLSAARIISLEAIVGGQFYGFDMQVNYSALDPKSMDSATFGNILPRRAQQVFRFDIDRQLGDASLGTTLNVEGRRYDDLQNTRQIDGFVTWDIRAQYQFFEQVILQGTVNNILNTQYQTAAGYNSPGVTVFFHLRYEPTL
jgi:vitamin B12 transporter